MKTNAFIFDLDDTLIDTRRRHFQIVQDFINSKGKTLEFDYYLNMRKVNGWTNKEVIKNEYNFKTDEFAVFWKLNIENPLYLKYDLEIVDYKLLNEVKKKFSGDLILLSLRRNSKEASKQFKNFSFYSLFDKTNFLEHNFLNPKIDKLKSYKKSYQHVIFIGDTQEDCKAAKVAGVQFEGVQTGFYQLNCDKTFDNINSFLINQLDDVV